MHQETLRRVGLGVAIVLIGTAILVIEEPWEEGSTVPDPPMNAPASALEHPGAPNFAGATGWLNTHEPLELTEQRGKVVLVDFWTYSCINCINTFPYLRAWHDAYAEDGLVIVGVHSPEFRFERDIDNVAEATQRYNLTYPVAQDNDFDIWSAYNNRFWPAKYLIDQYGRIRYTHFGEGAYENTEQAIRQLLEEAGHDPGPPANGKAQGGGLKPGQTPELFASHLDGHREAAIGNEQDYEPGTTQDYRIPNSTEKDLIYLGGTWHSADQYSEAREDNASVELRFKAGGANFVANDNDGHCATIRLDGAPIPDDLQGPDVTTREDGTTCLVLDADRAYDFYAGPFQRHTVHLDVPRGFQLYSFAFSAEGRA